jgi:signal transduction histidine kinase
LRFAPRSSTDGLPFAAAVAAGASGALAAAALAAAWRPVAVVAFAALAGAAAALAAALVRARGWRRRLSAELAAQGAFADRLAASLAVLQGERDPAAVLRRTAEEAHRLLDADATIVLAPGPDGTLRPVAAGGLQLRAVAQLSVPASADSPLARAVPGAPPVLLAAPAGDPLFAELRPAAALVAPLAPAGEHHGVLLVLDLGRRPLAAADLARAAVVAEHAAAALGSALLFGRVESLLAQARLRESERAELSRRLVSVEQDERRRLSQFLHDGPLQTLSGVGMMLDAVAAGAADGDVDGALRVLATAAERQRGVIRSLRDLSFALEPWALRDRGFVSAVHALADEVERHHQLRVTLAVDDAEALAPESQVYLYQIVREAIGNTVKHAGPCTVAVTVRRDGGAVAVTIEDDGRGMAEPGRVPDDGLPHHGMASMRERAAILGSALALESAPGHGTAIRLRIPVDEEGVRAAA